VAGTLPSFDPDEFRDAIRFAQTMGMPDDVGAQATFYFAKTVTADAPVDDAGVPFAPETAVTRETSKSPVRVTCSIEDGGPEASETPIGKYGKAIVITLLDEEYEKVVGFEVVAYQGVDYDFDRELLASALGSVGIHRLLCISEGVR
jgi:hypothetical protein